MKDATPWITAIAVVLATAGVLIGVWSILDEPTPNREVMDSLANQLADTVLKVHELERENAELQKYKNQIEPGSVLASEFPPLFRCGDVVIPNGSTECGIVIALDRKKENEVHHWQVSVMFPDERLDYTQEQLTLVERINWWEELK